MLVIWQALLLTMLDHTATKWSISVQLTSSRCVQRMLCLIVTRSCRESLPVWSSSVYGSRNPRPRTHCARAYPLSSMAELQAQITAPVSQVTRCNCSSTNLTLNSSSSRRAWVFQIPPAHRLRSAVEWWLLSAWVRTPSLRAPVRTHARILLLDRKSIFKVRQKEWSNVWRNGPTRSSDACWESWQQHTIMLAKWRMFMKLNWLPS